MKLTPLIFLQVHPINERDYSRFGLAYLQQRGFRIRVFQIAELIGLKVATHIGLRDQNVDVVHIDTYEQLEAAVDEVDFGSLFLVLAQSDRDMSRVIVTLVDAGAHYVQLICGLVPPFVFIGSGWKSRFVKLMSPSFWVRKLSTAKQRLAMAVRLRRCVPDFVVVTGEKAVNLAEARWDAETLRERLVYSNSLDFDLYLEQQAQTPRACEPYCVFIDDGFLGHAEFDMFDFETPSWQQYQQEITNFFEKVETQTGLLVKVALSPRSSIDLEQQPFGDREVVHNRTSDLISQSRLVLAHCSTAIGFAVLFEKPVMLLETDELIDTQWGPIQGFSEALGCKVINISRADEVARIDWTACERFSASHYEAYRRNYLSSPAAPERRFWEIFVDALAARFTLP